MSPVIVYTTGIYDPQANSCRQLEYLQSFTFNSSQFNRSMGATCIANFKLLILVSFSLQTCCSSLRPCPDGLVIPTENLVLKFSYSYWTSTGKLVNCYYFYYHMLWTGWSFLEDQRLCHTGEILYSIFPVVSYCISRYRSRD